jgi:hypothetical protein
MVKLTFFLLQIMENTKVLNVLKIRDYNFTIGYLLDNVVFTDFLN